MAKQSLRSFFGNKGESYRHPLLTFLERFPADRVEIETVRPKDLLGFKGAKIYLHMTVDEKPRPPAEYVWDDDLNAALVARGIRSISSEAEKARFGLALRAGFRRIESRYGDGFFNAVLVLVIREEGFADDEEVAAILKHVSTNRPHMGGNAYGDCRAMIEHAISDRAKELTGPLKYPQDEATGILAGAMARYLDERFTVTDRIRLGWS